MLAPLLKAPPREVAERLGGALRDRLGEALERVEVAGPGFLNLFLADPWYVGALDWVLAAGDGYGGGGAAPALRVNVEFVSANPTGPLTAASGRHAAYGDALARVLGFAGHDVVREYYFNDAGTQIEKLGESIRARARGEEVPEGGYVRRLRQRAGRRRSPAPPTWTRDELARVGVELMFERIKATLRAYRVEYDVFFNEAALHEGSPSAIERGHRAPRRRRATSTAPTARCGCARPTSATTRTASSSARPARRRTSRPTSPTPRTSSSAASTCSSSRWAPTTTATWRG